MNLRKNKLIDFILRIYSGYSQDRVPFLAAGISYFALFSLFPLLLAFISLAGFLAISPEIEKSLLENILKFFPSVPESLIIENLKTIIGARASSGLVAIISSIWAGIGVFSSVQVALSQIFSKSTVVSFIRGRLKALLIILLVGVLVIVSTILQFFTAATLLLNIVDSMLSMVVSVVAFYIVYRFIIENSFGTRLLIIVSLFSAIVWFFSKTAFSFFLRFAKFNLSYGLIASSIVLLLWIYISANILLIGAEILNIMKKNLK